MDQKTTTKKKKKKKKPPRKANHFKSLQPSLRVFSRSSEGSSSSLRCASSLAVVSRGGVLVGSWGIWTPRGPRCPVCRSPCRSPSSRTGLRPFRPRWRWRTRAGSPGPPPEIDQEPGKKKKEAGKKREIMSDKRASIVWTEEELSFDHLPLSRAQDKVTIESLWLWKG